MANGGDNNLVSYNQQGQFSAIRPINTTINGHSDPDKGFLFNVIPINGQQMAFVDDNFNTVSFINITSTSNSTST